MSDWSLIRSYWLHFYKYQSMLPSLYSTILLEEDLLKEENPNLNHDEEEEEEKIGKGGE